MKEKKNGIEITITCDSKEELNNVAEFIREAIISGKLGAPKDDSDEPEPKAFCPKQGDICAYAFNEGVDTIFRYNGETRTDGHGSVWLDGDLALTLSEDLLKPYMIIHGEDVEYFRDYCRLANDEEIKLFNEKVKEFEGNKKEESWEPKQGESFWMARMDVCDDYKFIPVLLNETLWNTNVCKGLKKKGWAFRTEEECKSLCDKLNEAIKNVKP